MISPDLKRLEYGYFVCFPRVASAVQARFCSREAFFYNKEPMALWEIGVIEFDSCIKVMRPLNWVYKSHLFFPLTPLKSHIKLKWSQNANSNSAVTYNVFEPRITRALVAAVIQDFQSGAVERVREGYTGREPGHQTWTFSTSLMFSLAVFTTIGQSPLSPPFI